MGTMLEVLNAASGQSAATSDKFPNHVLNGRYAAGLRQLTDGEGRAALLARRRRSRRPASIGAITASVWERFAAAEPGADFTRIFPFVEGSRLEAADMSLRFEVIAGRDVATTIGIAVEAPVRRIVFTTATRSSTGMSAPDM